MTSVEDIVDTLLELEPSDRSWIMEQLTPAQRERLAAQLRDDEHESTPASARGRPLSNAGAPVSAPADARGPDRERGHESAQLPERSYDADLLRLSKAAPAQLAGIVRREPAWIVHALLSGQPRERSHDVLALLPPGTRSEVARLATSEIALTPAVTRFLVGAAAARLQGPDDALRASRFDRLVDTMRSRLQRMPRLRRRT